MANKAEIVAGWCPCAAKDAFPLEELSRAIEEAGVKLLEVGKTCPGSCALVICKESSTEARSLIAELSSRERNVITVVCGVDGFSSDCAWNLLASGASDVLLWEDAAVVANQVSARIRRWDAVGQVLNSHYVSSHLAGCGKLWKKLLRQVIEAARFTEAPILLQGESGTGKELLAGLIAHLDPHATARGPTVLDCTTIVPELSGSEFFGHERGAFTGAVSQRDGAFALADQGVLFLDEVGELPLDLQAKLLRVVQEQTYKRVGGDTWRKTRFRLVCATNRNLEEMVRKGSFRSDLYYRIAGWVFTVPPLSQRSEDILPLSRHFLADIFGREDIPDLSKPLKTYLSSRRYPGNVRDLKQLIHRLAYRHMGAGPISIGALPEEERPGAGMILAQWDGEMLDNVIRLALANGKNLKEIGRAAEDAAERIALEESDGNRTKAAERLGLTTRALEIRRYNRLARSGS